MGNYTVYVVTNWNNKVLYVGVTNDLERRISEHRNKLIDGFTKKYNLTKLVFYENFSRIEDAVAAEKRIKGWIRRRKDDLISSKNPEWKDLAGPGS